MRPEMKNPVDRRDALKMGANVGAGLALASLSQPGKPAQPNTDPR